MLALENWSRPSIDELGVPREPWQRVHERNQQKFNMQVSRMSVPTVFYKVPDYVPLRISHMNDIVSHYDAFLCEICIGEHH
jgi:hypothetical protein